MTPEDFQVGERVALVMGVGVHQAGEQGTVVGHTGMYISVKFDSQGPDVQWTDCGPNELAKVVEST